MIILDSNNVQKCDICKALILDRAEDLGLHFSRTHPEYTLNENEFKRMFVNLD